MSIDSNVKIVENAGPTSALVTTGCRASANATDATTAAGIDRVSSKAAMRGLRSGKSDTWRAARNKDKETIPIIRLSIL